MESAVGLGRRGRVAGQFEHSGDMRHVGGADLLRILPLAEIIVAFRQPEAALTEARDHRRGVLVVDLHAEVEADVQALDLQLGDDRNQFLGAGNRLNAVNHGASGRNPSRSIAASSMPEA